DPDPRTSLIWYLHVDGLFGVIGLLWGGDQVCWVPAHYEEWNRDPVSFVALFSMAISPHRHAPCVPPLPYMLPQHTILNL
ncbi:hypothetical protein CONPUDRAFT_86119, partial [Coniophora puteana RWD-64-598 SS2]